MAHSVPQSKIPKHFNVVWGMASGYWGDVIREQQAAVMLHKFLENHPRCLFVTLTEVED